MKGKEMVFEEAKYVMTLVFDFCCSLSLIKSFLPPLYSCNYVLGNMRSF